MDTFASYQNVTVINIYGKAYYLKEPEKGMGVYIHLTLDQQIY